MADDDLGPEGFGTRGIPPPGAATTSGSWTRWSERRWSAGRNSSVASTRSSPEVDRAGGLEHLTRDLKSVGDDVARILEVAKEAADGMRTRAHADAEDITAEAVARGAAVVVDAEGQAFNLRRDAWESGTEALDLVRRRRLRSSWRREDGALLVRAEAGANPIGDLPSPAANRTT